MKIPLLALVLPFAATLAPVAPTMNVAAAPAAIVTVRVVMMDRKFHPQIIRLKQDQPTRLVLINRDTSGHNFDSKGFFSHADIRDFGAGAQAVHTGLISVPSQSTKAFIVTPRTRGPYDLNSSVALDVASGMQGQILVY